jgi:ubiquinone/menaquinone biosynthesis C-methylase UbiE
MTAFESRSMERIVPDLIRDDDLASKESLELHIQRYEFAASVIPAKSHILDVACGVGYGSRILHDRIPDSSVTGIDLDSETITYAKSRYGAERLTFCAADAAHLPLTQNPFDAIVSLETLEHLQKPEEFLRRVASRLLKQGGLFVGSVPITPSVDANPHHLHDFTASSFRRLFLQNGLEEVSSLEQLQPFNPFRLAGIKERRSIGVRPKLLEFYLRNPSRAWARLKCTLTSGFTNKYLTLAARKV